MPRLHTVLPLLASCLVVFATSCADEVPDGDDTGSAAEEAALGTSVPVVSLPFCQIVRRGETLSLVYLSGGTPSYEAVLGAGGAIAALQIGGANALAPSFHGELTDRVIHSVRFHEDIAMPPEVVGKVWNGDYRFNVNQAGDRLGSKKHPEGVTPLDWIRVAPDRCRIDLQVSARLQFNEALDPFFRTVRQIEVTYEIRDSGELAVHKREVLSPIELDARHIRGPHPDSMWLEEWAPFRPSFVNKVAARLDQAGAPLEVSDFSRGRELRADASSGYVVAWANPNRGIGVVYGTRVVTRNGVPEPGHYTRLLQYRAGDVRLVDPQLIYDGLSGPMPIGRVIEQTYFLVPRVDRESIFGTALREQLERLVPEAGALLTGP